MPFIAILGRQPQISLAELWSLYPGKLTRLSPETALITADNVDINRLGGTIKIAQLIGEIDQTDLREALTVAAKSLRSARLSGKQAIGLSLYGLPGATKDIFKHSLALKKQLRFDGISARIVPGVQMTAAQIQHNQMISRGADIVLVSAGGKLHIGRTIAVQDVARYGLRDYGRPARSARIGMLPPKLAQIMINLANPDPGSTILDPFCGTGVVLQEALLMGYDCYGSDIDSTLINMSERNLEWLKMEFKTTNTYRLKIGDATSMSWDIPIGAVVTEGYLGPALSTQPSASELTRLSSEATHLTLAFLTNLHHKIAKNTLVCLSIPAWRKGKTFERLNIVDQIQALGYTLKQFLPVKQTDLLYARDGQIVGRELIVIRSV